MLVLSNEVHSPTPSILIVEDEAVVALDLKLELEAQGYRVAGVAEDAAQARALAHRLRPDLALMDVMLRGDTDGIELAADLRSTLGLPIVFLTSFSDSETVQRAARTAAYGYLTKPYQTKELRAGIEVALWKSRMERQLRESDRWFALTLRCVQDGVLVMGADGRLRFMNTAAERLLGWSAERAAGRPIDELVRFADEEEVGEGLAARSLREGRVQPVRHGRRLRRADGSVAPVDESAAPVLDEAGALLGAVLMLRDASERLRQEALLRASEQRFRNAFHLAPLGMALVALDGRFLQVNDALCSLLAGDDAWLRQQTQAALTPPEDAAHETARLSELHGAGGPVVQFEKRYRRGAGLGDVWVLVSASLLSEAGEPTCYLYQVHDLTAQKLAATQLAELAAERVRREASDQVARSKTEFLARVSHEMRTPLNAVLGFAQLMQMRQDAGQPADGRMAQHILDAGRHLLTLVDDVLDLQRASTGHLRLAPAKVLLDDVLTAAVELLRPMADSRGVSIAHTVTQGLFLLADGTRLRQVLLNLGSNAIKYNRPGGHVLFAGSPGAPGRVRLVVEDSGIGMTDEQRGHLFEPFNRLGRESLREPGVGLGLVITRTLVEHMGGHLTVEAAQPQGTRVTLDLPAGDVQGSAA